MVTLATALLAGSAALLGQAPINHAVKVLSAVLLLASLAISLLGTMPLTARIDIRCPEEIKDERDKGVKYKTGCLKVGAFFLVLALGVLLLGMLIGEPNRAAAATCG